MCKSHKKFLHLTTKYKIVIFYHKNNSYSSDY